MPTAHLVAPDGTSTAVPVRAGQSLMRAATQAGIDGIAADCGGCCTCATCHVIVDAAWVLRLPPPGDDESAMLDMTATPREAGSRLSCCIVMDAGLDGLTARLPATQY
jgi:2Fe-2S ferredoxin